MTIEVMIRGRAALPIRAIPFVTGWSISPDWIASSLAQSDRSDLLGKLAAYHCHADGRYARMLPKEWDGIETDLQALSDRLRAEEKVENENYQAWRRESILILPAGVFVWKDEFVKAFSLGFSKERLTLIDERPGDRRLRPQPFVPADLLPLLFEGFSTPSVPREGSDTAAGPATAAGRNHVSEKLAMMNQAAKMFWENADRDDRGTHPLNAAVAAWLEKHGFSPSLAVKAATIIRPEWSPVGRKPEE